MDSDLFQRLLQGESPRVEYKESPHRRECLQAVTALANDLEDSQTPGYLLVGVNDRGAPIGERLSASDEDALLQKLTNWVHSVGILPTPSVSIEAVRHDDYTVIVIEVAPYAVPPAVKFDGVVYVRVGTTSRRATDADRARLEERRPEGHLPFDLKKVPEATLDDLDVEELRRLYRADAETRGNPETFPAFEKWLVQQDLLRGRPGNWRPNPTAILLYGLSPQSFLPGAHIEMVRFQGDDLDADVMWRKTITGSLFAQLDSLWTLLEQQITDLPAPDDGIRTPYVPSYPKEALRELARNLVQHRRYDATHAPGRVSWFDSMVVFNNPGGPFGQASEGQFGDHSDYRNPTITQGLAQAGYVERMGRGVRRVRLLLERNGNPELKVEHDGFTTVTVRRRA